MMIDIYVLDKNLELLGIIDHYKSLIWSNRYSKTGDCELYLGASADALQLLAIGNYLVRLDDDMICRIKKIEIDTDAEDGNYLIVTGKDAKDYLDQRIIWDTETCNGNLETFVRGLVTGAVISPVNADRRITKPNGGTLFALAAASGLSIMVSEQVSYKGLGEKIREYCQAYQLGYKAAVDLVNGQVKFSLYAGMDRSGVVVFSEEFDNLISTKYTQDDTDLGNVALIGGQGDGSDRIMDVYGAAAGADRYELFVDAKDMSPEIRYEDLKAVYPLIADGGTGYIQTSGGKSVYMCGQVDIQVMSPEHLADLIAEYPGGTQVTISGQTYYRLTDIAIADLQKAAPADEDTVTLRDLIYDVYLLNRGAEKVSEKGERTTFEGQVVPDVTFVYKTDYFLGDVVGIRNQYGIEAAARIIEVVEVMDENGYSMEPKFEYLDIEANMAEVIEAADSRAILMENGNPLLTERSVLNSRSASVADGVKISQLEEASDLGPGYFLPVASDAETYKVDYADLVDQVTEDVTAFHKGDTVALGDTTFLGRSFSSRTKVNLCIPLPKPLGDDITGVTFPAGTTITIRQANGTSLISGAVLADDYTVGLPDSTGGTGDFVLDLFIVKNSGNIGGTNSELLGVYFNSDATITFT